MNKMGNSKTVYRTILRPLLIVVLVEIVLMTGSYWLLGINGQLNKNARDILIQQTENRKSYLQNEMIQKWSNLSTISQTINERTQQLIDQDVISLQTLDSSSKASTPLLNEISKELISTLYSKETTGIFVILNTHDLRENKDNKPGIYIRNNDPSTFSVKEYGDLLLEKAPVEVVRSLNISTDTHWESTFDLSTEENTLLYKPFEKAYHDKIKMEAKEYGYWNEKSYHLKNNEDSAISYSMPLILPDGTVYGVVGVELLTSYLENLMPIDELKNDNQGSYVLSVEMNDQHNSLVVSSASVKRKQLKKFYLTEDNDKNMNSVESDDFIKAGQEFKGDNIEENASANNQKHLDKESVDERQSYINKEESSTDEENSDLDYKVKQLIEFIKNIWFKCRKLFGKIKHKVRSTKHKFKNNQKKFKYLIEYLKSEEVKTAYNYIKSKTSQIVKLLKPKKIRGKLEFGFESPDKTGKMLGVIAVVCTALKLNMDNFQIEPDFENKKFNGIIKAWGHFSIGVVGVYILQIYMKDEVHAVIDKFS